MRKKHWIRMKYQFIVKQGNTFCFVCFLTDAEKRRKKEKEKEEEGKKRGRFWLKRKKPSFLNCLFYLSDWNKFNHLNFLEWWCYILCFWNSTKSWHDPSCDVAVNCLNGSLVLTRCFFFRSMQIKKPERKPRCDQQF